MSKYTITIKKLIDNNFSFSLSDYPIFNEEYRDQLNEKILNHYYMDEIGFETAELFNFYLKNKMNEIMPYYNELYKSQEKILNSLFNNINITEIFNKDLNEFNNQNITSDSESQSISNTKSNYKGLYQDTPQGKISMAELENQQWATNADMNTNNSNSNINDTSTNNSDLTSDKKGNEKYTKTITGQNGMYNIDILTKIKNQLLNIDLMIIEDLKELFMGLM